MDINLKRTLPVISVLALIARPFLCRVETTKIVFISIVALLYTTLFYNYTIPNGARTYSLEKISIVIGNVPVDEYIYLILKNRSCLAVGLPLRPVEAAALKLQP